MNLFDGINTTWSRIEGGNKIGDILYSLEDNFNFRNPSKMIPKLLNAYELLLKLPESHWKVVKLKELKALIANCAGLYLEVVSNQQNIVPDGDVTFTVEAINRSNTQITIKRISSPLVIFPASLKEYTLEMNEKYNLESTVGTFSGKDYSSPYWLNEKSTMGMYHVNDKSILGYPEKSMKFPVKFHLSINDVDINFERNIVYKFNDPVDGEVYQPFTIVPVATCSIKEKVIIFSDQKTKKIPVHIRAGKDNIEGIITLNSPEDWVIKPQSHPFSVEKKGDQSIVYFEVSPPKEISEGQLNPIIQIEEKTYDKELHMLDYKYIPLQQVLMKSESKVVHLILQKKGENIGYIEGAGDAVPESLEQIGYQVTRIKPAEITYDKLVKFDAIVMGIRAYNTVPELEFKQVELNRYIENGGNLILQYNTSHRLITKDIAPFQIELSRDRVTDEFSEVSFLAPEHPILNYPNKISVNDFENWVQERGLYFPNKWAKEFTPLLGMNDKKNKLTKGALLVAPYGKGYYIYTGISFFRELPAGVPGAYRLFANMLSIGK
jgi:hypothetical protein